MEHITIAAAAVKNRINQKDKSILNMEKWIEKSKEKNTDLILFPELNVSGYILNPVVSDIAETIPGPSTEKIISLSDKYKITIKIKRMLNE